jgi:hypothetical protein
MPPITESVATCSKQLTVWCYSNRKMLKGLQTCFSSRDNPYGHSGPNEHFQREHDELMKEDRDYYLSPTVSRLCNIVGQLIYKWEAHNQ